MRNLGALAPRECGRPFLTQAGSNVKRNSLGRPALGDQRGGWGKGSGTGWRGDDKRLYPPPCGEGRLAKRDGVGVGECCSLARWPQALMPEVSRPPPLTPPHRGEGSGWRCAKQLKLRASLPSPSWGGPARESRRGGARAAGRERTSLRPTRQREPNLELPARNFTSLGRKFRRSPIFAKSRIALHFPCRQQSKGGGHVSHCPTPQSSVTGIRIPACVESRPA